MKHLAPCVTVSARDLRKAVAFASAAVEKWNTIPVLGNIRIDTGADKITVRGTDLDVEAITWCAAESSAPPLSFTVSPRLLAGIIRYADDLVEISMSGDIVTVKADDVTAEFRNLCPAADYPMMICEDADTSKELAISEARLHKAMRAVSICTSTEETRYYLNGIYFHPIPEKGDLRLVATDGHRLGLHDTHLPCAFDGAIVPRKACGMVFANLADGGNRTVGIIPRYVEERGSPDSTTKISRVAGLTFQTEDWKIVSKTIDGTYPQYSRVIPEASEEIRATLTDAAIRRFPVTSERSRALKIDPTAGFMEHVSPDAIAVRMPVQGKGPAFGFNLNYLRDFTRRFGTIRLEGKSPGDPFRVLTEDPDTLHILMPMRV